MVDMKHLFPPSSVFVLFFGVFLNSASATDIKQWGSTPEEQIRNIADGYSTALCIDATNSNIKITDRTRFSVIMTTMDKMKMGYKEANLFASFVIDTAYKKCPSNFTSRRVYKVDVTNKYYRDLSGANMRDVVLDACNRSREQNKNGISVRSIEYRNRIIKEAIAQNRWDVFSDAEDVGRYHDAMKYVMNDACPDVW